MIFCYLETAPSAIKGQLLYALPPEASQGDFDRDKSSLSGDFEASGLINGELSGPMSFYRNKFRGSYDLAWDRLLLPKRLLEERENQLRLNRIITTGLQQDEWGDIILARFYKPPMRHK